MPNPLEVFISSTCADLIDLRAVLADHLQQHGMRVRFSEEVNSGWLVEPGVDSMEICFRNIDLCDVVILIIDSRYGDPLLSGPFPGKSPIHAELLHTRKVGKNPLIFIRTAALSDYGAIAAGRLHEVRRVRGDPAIWKSFVDDVMHSAGGGNAWYDSFLNVMELKRAVHARITALHPEHAASLALQPDRYVRMIYLKAQSHMRRIRFNLRNVGVGAAVDVVCFVTQGMANMPVARSFDYAKWEVGGVPERDLASSSVIDLELEVGSPTLPPPNVLKLVCEYSNRFDDRYRIEVPMVLNPDTNWVYDPGGPEELYVHVAAASSEVWQRVGTRRP